MRFRSAEILRPHLTAVMQPAFEIGLKGDKTAVSAPRGQSAFRAHGDCPGTGTENACIDSSSDV